MEKTKAGKKLSKRESAFVTEILNVLLSGKESCLHTVTESGFAHLLIEGPQHFAVERLIAHFGSRQELADLVANAYLDRFKRTTRTLSSRDIHALDYAQRVAERFAVSGETAERIVGCMAEAGWYGRLESCARKYCKRDPKPEEVALLFKNYKAGASYSTSTDESLTRYAERYMPAAQAKEQLRLLEARNERFHAESGY